MRLIGYLKQEKPYFVLHKLKNFRITAYTNSNYATNAHDRKSIDDPTAAIGREDVEVCAEVTIGEIGATHNFTENNSVPEQRNNLQYKTTNEQHDDDYDERRTICPGCKYNQ
eukprot:CAMPEP_0176505822 /NCGR_PEP_ID=MMETSP0200_2-20121128/16707_1 /TAXON_ID=947934 /ORGANISM="Chaetoceros sp., Strain GSL56" /LENGTH=111 /DNA_ID=CAMNT_0017905417 /DNA_START=481 /DNA_END=816 /DNA_ORIENTATION=+